MFWRPELLPALVRVIPERRTAQTRTRTLDLWRGVSRHAILETAEGFHVVLAKGPQERRLWIESRRLPKPGTPLRAVVSLDGDLDRQIAAIRRLHDAAAGATPPPDLTVYELRMLARALQALDAHLAGASLRETAEALFGAERAGADWYRGGPLRDHVRYLVRRGRRLMAGGYRDLLRGAMPRAAG